MDFLKKQSLPLFLIITSLFLAFWGENSVLLLRYDRDEISNGEIWRLFSGHLLHTGWTHLWINLAALIVIWLLVQKYLTTLQWWITALLGSVGISLSLYALQSELGWYVGLSGLMHCLLVTGVIAAILHGRRESILLLLLIYFKVIWEQLYGPLSTDFVRLEGNIVVNAHLYGVIMGMLSALIFWCVLQPESTPDIR